MSTRRTLPRLVAALLAVATLTLSACTSDASDSKTYTFTDATAVGKLIPAKERKPAAAVDGKLLDGSTADLLSARKGKVVVLAFWASWCPPCRVEMPQLNDLHKQYAAKGVDFVGVDTKDDRDDAKSFVATNDIAFPIMFDPNGEVSLKLGNIPGTLPFTVLIDKSGRVAAVYIQRYAPKDLLRALAPLRAETVT